MTHKELQESLTKIEVAIRQIKKASIKKGSKETALKSDSTIKYLETIKESIQKKLNVLQEVKDQNILLTTKKGSTKVVQVPQGTGIETLKRDPDITKIEDTKGKVVKEQEERQISSFLAKTVGKVLMRVLRAEGNEISKGRITNLNLEDGRFIVRITYKQEREDSPVEEDKFYFSRVDTKLFVDIGEGDQEVGQIVTVNGVSTVETEVVADSLHKILFGDTGRKPMNEASSEEDFIVAVESWKANKSKDTAVNLLRVASRYGDQEFLVPFKEIVANYIREREAEEQTGAVESDSITMCIPLFIRVLEYVREEVKDDVEIHTLTEKAVELMKHKEVLTMEEYENLIIDKQEDSSTTEQKVINAL